MFKAVIVKKKVVRVECIACSLHREIRRENWPEVGLGVVRQG